LLFREVRGSFHKTIKTKIEAAVNKKTEIRDAKGIEPELPLID
jgi:hypothetical protein